LLREEVAMLASRRHLECVAYRILSAAVLGFLLVGCGRLNSGSATAPSLSPTGPEPSIEPLPSELVANPLASINFDNPISGEAVGSLAEASQYLPFAPLDPQGLGAAQAVYVGAPKEYVDASKALALIYDTEQFGRVDVLEGVPDITPVQWLASATSWANSNGQPGHYGTAELLSIRTGVEALLTTSQDGQHSVIEWLDGPIQVEVLGPTLDRDAVLKIAETL